MEGASVIERFSKGLYLRNEAALLKGIPLFFGYLIFFIYFVRSGFFPSVDFFGFVSITISAFLIGLAIFFYIQIFVWLGPWVWMDAVFSEVKYKKHLNIWMLENGKRSEGVFRVEIVLKRLLFPLFISQVVFGVSLYQEEISFLSVTLGIAVLFLLPVSCAFFHVYSLDIPFSDFVHFSFAYFFVFSFSAVSSLLVMVSLNESHNYSLAQCISLGCIVSFFATTFSFVSQFFKTLQAFLFRMIIFLFIFFCAGMYSYVPGRVVAFMGLGNYYAEKIVLKEDYCKLIQLQYPSLVSCAFDNPHVIWGEGEMLKIFAPLNYAYENEKLRRSEECSEANDCSQGVRIPRDAIVAIVE